MGQTPPPPGRYSSSGRTPPPRILRDTVKKRAVRILLECILVFMTVNNIECKSVRLGSPTHEIVVKAVHGVLGLWRVGNVGEMGRSDGLGWFVFLGCWV